MTVADMERLEHAARLSMGGLPDADTPAATWWNARYVRFFGVALVAAAALLAVLKLL